MQPTDTEFWVDRLFWCLYCGYHRRHGGCLFMNPPSPIITDSQVFFKLECISKNTKLIHSDSTESLPSSPKWHSGIGISEKEKRCQSYQYTLLKLTIILGVWHSGGAEHISMYSTKEDVWCCCRQGWSLWTLPGVSKICPTVAPAVTDMLWARYLSLLSFIDFYTVSFIF